MNNESKEKKLEQLALEEITRIKEKYPIGTKVIMRKLHNGILPKPGLLGNVEKIDEFGRIIVRYKVCGTITLIDGLDEFEIYNTCL